MSQDNTEWFKQVYGGDVGSPEIQCRCGRTHFATAEGSYWESKADLARMRMHAKEDPQHYFEDSTVDSIIAVHISGTPVVIGCECRQLERYEQMIWDERTRILKYFEARQRYIDMNNRLLGDQIRAAKGKG